jgi:murein DD-endopeptidase MepM/ murein hydrolase activator NlpD
VHDGVDLICPANEPALAICTGTIVRVQAGGWWGKGAPSPAVAAKGDGIIVLRCDIEAGPFKPGLLFGYGHAENACVKVGQKVRAGEKIGEAGLANAYHLHFMVHGPDQSPPLGGTGDRDPMPYVDYARRND